MLKPRWINCFWLLIPVLAWNAVFSAKLAHPAFNFDDVVPGWVLLLENLLRAAVMLLPLLMPVRWDAPFAKIGIVVYLLGLLLYFASWIPLMVMPTSVWSISAAGFLAPAYIPLLWLVGIGFIGGWWPYLAISVIFVGVHVSHWGQVFFLVAR